MTNNPQGNHSESLEPAEFVRLLTMNQRKIYAYIVRLVGNYHDADDILQETTSVMWNKLSSFQKGSNFLGWAIRIAHYNILNYRKRTKELLFDEDVFDSIAQQVSLDNDIMEDNISYLKQCLSELKEKDFSFIDLRYMKGYSIRAIAEQTSRTPQSLYRTLGRIHELLMKCIGQKKLES